VEEIKPKICPFKDLCRKKTACGNFHPGDRIPPQNELWNTALEKSKPFPKRVVEAKKETPMKTSPVEKKAAEVMTEVTMEVKKEIIK